MKNYFLFLLSLNLISFGQTAKEYHDRGEKKSELEDYTGAIADYSKAIQLKPDYVDAYSNRGVAKRKKLDYTGAFADYSMAIQLNPDYADAYNNRGVAKYFLQDYTGSITDLNKAIQLRPDYVDYFYSRGSAKYALQDYTGALIDFNKAIQLKPDNATFYYTRGNIKTYLKDMNGACTDWTKAEELGYSDALTSIQKYCKVESANEVLKRAKALVARLTEIKIGTQTWTGKNLDVEYYRNGDAIPQVQNDNEWDNLTTGAWCYYANKGENGTTYGKLYNWYAVTDPRGLAPEGYHIPSDEEWKILTTYLGEIKASKKMKSTSGWGSITTGGRYDKTCPNCANWSELYRTKNSCHRCKDNQVISAYEPEKTYLGNGTNSSGFNALPGGNRASVAIFFYIGDQGNWWSSSEFNPKTALHCELNIIDNVPGGTISSNDHEKQFGMSVRCVKD